MGEGAGGERNRELGVLLCFSAAPPDMVVGGSGASWLRFVNGECGAASEERWRPAGPATAAGTAPHSTLTSRPERGAGHGTQLRRLLQLPRQARRRAIEELSHRS